MARGDSSKNISFSFAGCGFLGLYHVGVASCLREYAPISPTTKIGGASAGALAAMALACDLPLGESTSEILQVAIKARARALGPFHPSFDVNKIIYDGLVKTLPDDAHLRANGRLYISVTRISDGKNVIINKFKSKEELIKAIQCSCFIPVWSGLVPPKFNGVAYIDGGFSDNLPVISENTVTVSPFSGESDICPQDETFNLFQVNLVNTSFSVTPANFYRITRILFPAHPEVLSKMCQQGFDDAVRYLQRNNKISCMRCLAIHFTVEKEDLPSFNNEKKLLVKNKHIHTDKHSMENCRDCEYRRQIAVLDTLPESVVQAIQEACDEVNKGLINWLFRHKPMKLLSIMSIPYLLPIDITIVLFYKIYEKLPDIKKELKNSIMKLVAFLRSLLVKIESKRYLYSAKFSCQLAVKEFDYYKEETQMGSRKSSIVSSTLQRKKSLSQKNVSKVEKANSFSGLKSAETRTLVNARSVESSLPKTMDKSKSPSFSPERMRKTSYAGREFHTTNRKLDRRMSMVETSQPAGVVPPERVISKMNFDFNIDMKNKSKSSEVETGVKHDAKVIDIDLDEIDQSNAIDIANKALDWEKELLDKCKKLDQSQANFDKMFEITRKQDAVMAYYYTDENNKVKFTELFNIKGDDLEEIKPDPAEPKMTTYNDSDDGLMETSPYLASPLTFDQDSPTKRRKSAYLGD